MLDANLDLAERLGKREVVHSLACRQQIFAVPVLCLLPPEQRGAVKEVARLFHKLKNIASFRLRE